MIGLAAGDSIARRESNICSYYAALVVQKRRSLKRRFGTKQCSSSQKTNLLQLPEFCNLQQFDQEWKRLAAFVSNNALEKQDLPFWHSLPVVVQSTSDCFNMAIFGV